MGCGRGCHVVDTGDGVVVVVGQVVVMVMGQVMVVVVALLTQVVVVVGRVMVITSLMPVVGWSLSLSMRVVGWSSSQVVGCWLWWVALWLWSSCC